MGQKVHKYKKVVGKGRTWGLLFIVSGVAKEQMML